MTELLTAAQMRAIEQAAIASGEVTGLELMERAGRGVAEAILEWCPELATTSHRAVVLCGPGNNGGDGFVVARLLKQRGWEVEVFLYGNPEKLPPDAKVNCERWLQLGSVSSLSMPEPTADEVERLDVSTRVTMTDPGPALIVDALFGTGLRRPISGLKNALEEAQIDLPGSEPWSPYVVAVDIPSGLCADSGRIVGERDGCAVGAQLTVSFHRLKRGHVLAAGPAYSGRVRTADIGLDQNIARNLKALAELESLDWPRPGLGHVISASLEQEDLHPDLSKAPEEGAHKYTHGHALTLSGGVGRSVQGSSP
jgi:hydroxyethylthiazole kinase-like uncharacterized protein yjeF